MYGLLPPTRDDVRVNHRIEEHALGLSWVIDEVMARASHALHDGSRVWLIDPVDVPAAIDRAAALGEPQAVIQLLDRHNRDCAAVAQRLGVPHLRLPDAIADSPFEVVKVIDVPRWRELALWWPERKALVVSEAVGSGRYFALADGPAGIHPFLRVKPPGAPKRFAPEHLLFGHGPGVHGPAAAVALRDAYARSRRDIPTFIKRLPSFR
jgi:hypothetical protein